MSIRVLEKGDTIIEALLAITIFSLVAVGSLALMNKGSATAQRALEITAVRHQIDNQAELLRYINNAYLSNPSINSDEKDKWNEIRDKADANIGNAIGPIDISSGACPALTSNSLFVLTFGTDEVQLVGLNASNFKKDPASFAQLRLSPTVQSDGLWIEAKKLSGNNYIDFYIRSCWQTIGQKVPMTIQTIVRLYDK